MNIELSGIIRFTAPFHQTSPREARVDQNGRLVNGDRGFPCARTEHWDQPTIDGDSLSVPVLTANSFRGRFRRVAATLVEDQLKAKGQRITQFTYNCLRSGAPFGSPGSEIASLEEQCMGRNHPFIGVFGGGPRMLRSRLVTNTVWPVLTELQAIGVIPNDIPDEYINQRRRAFQCDEESDETESYYRLTQRIFMRRMDDLAQMVDPLAPDVVHQYKRSVDEWQAITRGGRNAEAGDEPQDAGGEKGDKNYLDPLNRFNAMEIVRAGTLFHFLIELDSNCTPAQVGLVLHALRALERERLGGWARLGFGRFRFEQVTMSTGDPGNPAFCPFADGGEQRVLNPDVGFVSEANEAYQDAMAHLEAQELETIFKLGDSLEKKVHKAREHRLKKARELVQRDAGEKETP